MANWALCFTRISLLVQQHAVLIHKHIYIMSYLVLCTKSMFYNEHCQQN